MEAAKTIDAKFIIAAAEAMVAEGLVEPEAMTLEAIALWLIEQEHERLQELLKTAEEMTTPADYWDGVRFRAAPTIGGSNDHQRGDGS